MQTISDSQTCLLALRSCLIKVAISIHGLSSAPQLTFPFPGLYLWGLLSCNVAFYPFVFSSLVPNCFFSLSFGQMNVYM